MALLSRHIDTFAGMLDASMAARGMTGLELAARLNRRESTVSRWRNGHALPSDADLEGIIAVMEWGPETTTRARRLLNRLSA